MDRKNAAGVICPKCLSPAIKFDYLTKGCVVFKTTRTSHSQSNENISVIIDRDVVRPIITTPSQHFDPKYFTNMISLHHEDVRTSCIGFIAVQGAKRKACHENIAGSISDNIARPIMHHPVFDRGPIIFLEFFAGTTGGSVRTWIIS